MYSKCHYLTVSQWCTMELWYITMRAMCDNIPCKVTIELSVFPDDAYPDQLTAPGRLLPHLKSHHLDELTAKWTVTQLPSLTLTLPSPGGLLQKWAKITHSAAVLFEKCHLIKFIWQQQAAIKVVGKASETVLHSTGMWSTDWIWCQDCYNYLCNFAIKDL